MVRKPQPGPKYRSISKVAEDLDVSTKTVRRWIASGDLIVHRIGSVVRVSEGESPGLSGALSRCLKAGRSPGLSISVNGLALVG